MKSYDTFYDVISGMGIGIFLYFLTAVNCNASAEAILAQLKMIAEKMDDGDPGEVPVYDPPDYRLMYQAVLANTDPAVIVQAFLDVVDGKEDPFVVFEPWTQEFLKWGWVACDGIDFMDFVFCAYIELLAAQGFQVAVRWDDWERYVFANTHFLHCPFWTRNRYEDTTEIRYGKISPVNDGVYTLPDGSYLGFIGYNNSIGARWIPFGPNNRVDCPSAPNILDARPVEFRPGRGFRVAWTILTADYVVWRLDGGTPSTATWMRGQSRGPLSVTDAPPELRYLYE
jgi:hypothetical protein